MSTDNYVINAISTTNTETPSSINDVIATVAGHFIMTLPSFTYHGCYNLYNRLSRSQIPITYPNLKDEKVIVFVHGRGGHYTDFNTLISNMKTFPELSIYHMIAVDLGNTSYTSVDNDANKLQLCLENFENCSIILVGLSKGGLVIMRYLSFMSDPRIIKCITISAPLRGTLITNFLNKDSIIHKELGYKNTNTEDIIHNIKMKNLWNHIYHIIPLWDNVIIPTNSARYDETNNDHCYYYNGYYNHVGITCVPEIADILSTWITT